MNRLILDINERRKRLRDALTNTDTSDISDFAVAFAGASEEERATLARTLPATKLFKAEGRTPRAYFVLAALGKPGVVVELSFPDFKRTTMAVHAMAGIEKFTLAAAQLRDRAWQLAFIDALSLGFPHDSEWRVARALIEANALRPESVIYLRWFLTRVTWGNYETLRERSAAEIAAMLAQSDCPLLLEFWALFRIEGMGSGYALAGSNAWLEAILILCDTVPGFRGRVLDESLGALLKDFVAKNTFWYPHLHRALDPTADEIAARAGTYETLLASAPSASVGLAQDMLARTIDRLAPDGLLDASVGILRRSEKRLLTAQLKLLSALVKARPECAAQVSKLVVSVMDALPAYRAVTARKLILPDQAAVSESVGAAEHAAPGGAPVTVAEPRREAIPHEPDQLAPLTDEGEFWTLVSACLEGVGFGRDLPRILDFLSRTPDLAAGPHVLARAADVMTSVWDWVDASPRRHLGDLLTSRAQERPRQITYVGYRRFLCLRPGEPVPGGVAVRHDTNAILMMNRDGTWTEAEAQRFRYGDVSVPSEAPTALLIAQFQADAGQVSIVPLPAVARQWERAMLPPGRGHFSYDVFGTEPRPVWLPIVDASHAMIVGPDLGFGRIQDEYTLRAEEARQQDGFDQIVQWAAWLLSDNPDTLAAIYHPVLDAAVRVVNVRGVGVLLAALGQTRQVPHGPVWSALALGLSAKMPEHRATAAEAVATLAKSGLLDPSPFAAEISAHLKDEHVLAGRLATALADAASINALAGYRVLQTLAALLSHLDGVTQAARLIELTARLAADYGTRVLIPDALARKRKGSSVMAAALRALNGVTSRPTPLAQEAAAQAAASLADQEESEW